MAGIVNSSQHCYFNSLFQCLANSSRIYDYLDEHEREIRNVVGESIPSVTLPSSSNIDLELLRYSAHYTVNNSDL